MNIRQNLNQFKQAYDNELASAAEAHNVFHAGAVEQQEDIRKTKYALLGNEAVSAAGVVNQSEMQHVRGIAIEQVTGESQAIPVSFSESHDQKLN